MKDTDYLAISARVRAMEARPAGGSYADLLDSVEAFCPDKRLTDFFRIKYDYHNLKALIKGRVLGRDVGYMLSSAGRVKPQILERAFELGDLTVLPEDMKNAAETARETLVSTGDPRLCDIRLDKACFETMGDTSKCSGFLNTYFRLLTDLTNMNTVYRCRRMYQDANLLGAALIDGGNVSPGTLTEQGEAGTDALIQRCKMDIQNHLYTAKQIPFGAGVVVAFLIVRGNGDA